MQSKICKMIRLCSSSPTRAKLLRDFKIKYEQVNCDFDEDILQIDNPKSFVYYASKGKFECCKEKYGIKTPLLAADTVVTTQNKLLRKAKTQDDAKQMLLLQSGSEVSIITSVFFQSKNFLFSDISVTVYKMYKFKKDDLQRYLESNQWQGKAGAIMVEGFCKKYIKSVQGLESCAMGLQVEKILPYV